MNFNDKAIKASEDVKSEMQRLNENLLDPLTVYTCPDNYITIGLLNVRSLVSKLPDIECDASASILCFTETWLQPDIESPVVRGKNQSLRSDRASGDIKGGVLVNLADNIKISNKHL